MVGSKKQLIYIHGGDSFLRYDDFIDTLKTRPLWHIPGESTVKPGKKWTATLETELGDEWEIILPPMPNRENAKFEEWKIWFERHFEYLRDGAIVIGSSLGAMFLGRYLVEHELPFKARAIILMAGALPLPGEDHAEYGDFLIDVKKVGVIAERNRTVIIIHSKDDFVVPFSHGEILAEAIPEAEFMVFEDKNHFLIEEFPELIEKIKELAG